jgi:hypothetical protein
MFQSGNGCCQDFAQPPASDATQTRAVYISESALKVDKEQTVYPRRFRGTCGARAGFSLAVYATGMAVQENP